MKDEGCPTCGSKKIVDVDVRISTDGTYTWNKRCDNCKKSWFSST